MTKNALTMTPAEFRDAKRDASAASAKAQRSACEKRVLEGLRRQYPDVAKDADEKVKAR